MSVSGEESVKSTKRTIAMEILEFAKERIGSDNPVEVRKVLDGVNALNTAELSKEYKELQKGQKKGKKEKEVDEHGNVIKKPQSAQLGPWGGFSKRCLELLKTENPKITSTAANRVGKLVCLPKRATPKTALTQENYDSIEDQEILDCYNEWKDLPFEEQYEKKEKKDKKGKKSGSSSEVSGSEEEETEVEEEEPPKPVAKPVAKKVEAPKPKPVVKKEEAPKPKPVAKKEEPKPVEKKVEAPKPKPTRPALSDTEKETLIYKEGQYVNQKVNGKEYVTYTHEGELYCFDKKENYYGKYNKKSKKVDGSVPNPFTVEEETKDKED